MRPFLVFLFILLLLAFEGNCWRRRRRRRSWWRRRRCHAKNCGVSQWSSWSSCSHQCGLSGVQTRTRRKSRTESCGGSCPYALKQTRACNRNKCGNRGWSWYGRCICNRCWTGTCCHIARRRNCLVSSWSSWSSCSHQCGRLGVQTRTRYKSRTESCGGSCPYGFKQTRACNRNKCRNRGWSWYGRCICYSGWTGKCCNKRRARNCLVSRWSSWSSCSHQCGYAGVQTRTRRKIRTESNGGRCPYSFKQRRACNRNKCRNKGWASYGRCICYSGWKGKCCDKRRPRNCLVSRWSSWSSCSHQCGYAGVQIRTRRKIRTESNGGRCPYSLRRTRACNRNKCRNRGRPTYGRCICYSGWKGKCCNKKMDACAKEPCQNNGTCTSVGSSYQCNCTSGFNGTNCEDIDACAKEPCQNNGTCTSVGSSYKCNCTSGFNGTNCEVMINSSYKECREYQLLSNITRNVEYRHGGSLQCDRRLTKGWYRFGGGAGTKMSESCVPKNRCGTHAPGWLNGTHPTVDEGNVTRKVCYHWRSKCCLWSNAINVINCGPYFVYNLGTTRFCFLRYCGTD